MSKEENKYSELDLREAIYLAKRQPRLIIKPNHTVLDVRRYAAEQVTEIIESINKLKAGQRVER